jgi:hypothetical protein
MCYVCIMSPELEWLVVAAGLPQLLRCGVRHAAGAGPLTVPNGTQQHHGGPQRHGHTVHSIGGCAHATLGGMHSVRIMYSCCNSR